MPGIAITPQYPNDREFSYEDLQHFTDNFSEENFIGRTGNSYQDRMWNTQTIITGGIVWRRVRPDYLLDKVKDEIRFMDLPFLERHQNVAKVLGHCFEENKLGVVYDLKPLNTVRNIVKDKARLLKLLHWYEPEQYLVRNLSAAHVIVDPDFNPVVVDFAMINGGDIGGENSLAPHALSSYGYDDIYVWLSVTSVGFWTMRSDVFNFGVILLELITKHTCDDLGPCSNKFINYYARKFYRGLLSKAKDGVDVKCSYVQSLLQADPDFDVEDGTELTMIALDCVKYRRPERPDMEEVLSILNLSWKNQF
ncbi:hypothetical protein ACJIZ3_009199 [Penstemon smallii]|uniref:Protein kinase domain-containing protein n=1 Tax=Penstemon smallii TaxID=265156 RepID=A0ABD3TDK0_9LAMI